MASLPPVRNFIQDDYSGITTIPSFAGKLFYPLNLFLNAVYRALNNGLTLTANTIGLVSTQTSITSSSTGVATTTINWPYPQTPPTGLAVLSCYIGTAATTYPAISWSYRSGVITINMQFFKVSGSALVTDTAKTYSLTFWSSGG